MSQYRGVAAGLGEPKLCLGPNLEPVSIAGPTASGVSGLPIDPGWGVSKANKLQKLSPGEGISV